MHVAGRRKRAEGGLDGVVGEVMMNDKLVGRKDWYEGFV